MSNVEITKQHKNVTSDKLNVNYPQRSLIFRLLKVVRSLPPPDDFGPSENQATKKWKWVFTPPPREMQAGEYEVIVLAFPRPCPGGGGQGGFKWLVHYVNRITYAHTTYTTSPLTLTHPFSLSLSTFRKKTAHIPWRTSWSSPKMCLPCLIIIQSCYFDFRINKPFTCSCCMIYVSCSVHFISMYYMYKEPQGFLIWLYTHCVLGGRGGRREEGGEVEMLAKFKLCHMTRNFLWLTMLFYASPPTCAG